ncbi:MAG: GAF domain-containing sensor histidine kinase, partial [Chloroflexi bacterium]|nr:GAF domain-containing sensor histidine kinase [Chloroflexota bacterium]
MSNLRRGLGFVLMVIIMTGLIAVTIQYAPSLLGSVPPLALMGAALLLAIIFQVGHTVVDQVMMMGDETPAAYNPLKVAQEFSLRAAGILDASELAAATSAVIGSTLKAPRSGWLLLTPQEANFTVQPVAGKGHLPTESLEFSRNNLLLRQLDLQRKPVLQSALEADPKYAQMTPGERDWLKQLGMQVYVPVFDAGLLTAVLMVAAKDNRDRFRPADLELLMILAGQAGAALKTMRVIVDLKNVNESMTTLNTSLRETLEALSKMNAARSDFLAIASHELRTPITQLLGFADLLGSMAQDNSFDPAMVTEITDSIVRACIRLGEVISQILEMAQIDVEAVNLSYGDTTVENILRQSLEPYAQALRDRRLSLTVKGIRSVPPLRADEQRLVGAFSQIISNAIKFTPDGRRIEISARLLSQEGDKPPQVEIVVADSGIGLDPKDQSLIFEKFYRVGSSAVHSTGATKFMGGGPGLGLPIAKGVIERHGGRIWVE